MATLQRKRIEKSLALQASARRKFKLLRVGCGKSQRCLGNAQGLPRLKVYPLKASVPRGCVGRTCLGIPISYKGQVIAVLKAGLPVGSFNRLQNALAIRTQELAGIVQIPVRTLARRQREKRLGIGESERVFRIGMLFDRAVEVLGGEERARQWFKSPQRALAGQTPLEYADTEPGAREVEDLLGRLEYGVFA